MVQKEQVENMHSNEKMLRLASDTSTGAGSVLGSARYRGRAEKTGSEVADGVLSPNETIIVIGMLVLGSIMQAFANGAIEAVLVMLFFLLVGRAVIVLVFPNRKPEMRAFLLMFAVCIFVGGLAQIYSTLVFHDVQSTIDARTTLRKIGPEVPYRTLETISAIHPGPLAVMIWQKVYEVASWLGLKFGAYSGVMFNALVMGLIGSFTVQIARELFGDDSWRLRRVGTLVAANGMFILFGAILLRECFTTFFVTLVLWGAIHLLVRAKARWLLINAAIIGISTWAMQYLRKEVAPLFILYGILMFLFWLFKKSGFVNLIVICLLLLVVFGGGVFLSSHVQDYVQALTGIQTSELEKYVNIVEIDSAEDSLGREFVYNQPLPIRLVLGSVTFMLSPIPLWAHFWIGAGEYHWIKGYNGLYQLFVLPFVFAGALAAFRMFFRDTKRSWPLMFLIIFVLINLIGVVATSLETRHFGQFMSAVVILAAIPDTREKGTENELRSIRAWWFFGVLLAHLAWAILKVT